MNITLNGLENPENILAYTDVYNILKVYEAESGTKARITLTFNSNMPVLADNQYYLTMFTESVSNVISPENANNKRFYISPSAITSAASLAKALRNCNMINAGFNIMHQANSVVLTSKTIGPVTPNIITNMPENYFSYTIENGTADSSLYKAKINVDVYDITSGENDYATTLEKNFYGNECAFDISPVLSTITDYGKTPKFRLIVSAIKNNGEYENIKTFSGYTTYGYEVNDSDRYKYVNDLSLLINDNKDQIRYVYGYTIPFSFLWGDGVGGFTLTINYLDSAYNIISSTTTTYKTGGYSSHIVDTQITIPDNPNIYYVDFGVNDKMYRYNVIKPLKMADDYQRILWRGEYGQVSFFDFTGAITETDDMEIETYDKSIYDYYDGDAYEARKIYSQEFNKQVKLTSHLMEENGKYELYSLMKSKRVWKEENGKKIYIIPKNVEISEDGTYDNLYKATLTYEYSDKNIL